MNKLTCPDTESLKKRGRSLLVIVSTPPTKNYENFTSKVQEFNAKEPFNFTTPILFNQNNYTKVSKMCVIVARFLCYKRSFLFFLNIYLAQFVSIYAAYLYDSVKLYAWALDKLLKQETRPLNDETIFDIASNGTRIIETIIKNKTYKSKLILNRYV